MDETKNCLFCDTEFETDNPKRAYCSTSCNKKLWEINDRKNNQITKECDFCKSEFKAYKKKPQKYCKDECRVSSWAFQKIMCGEGKLKKCTQCDAEFEDTTIDSRRMYCGKNCKDKSARENPTDAQREHRNEWKRKWYKENPESVKETSKRSRTKHRDARIAGSLKYQKKRRKEDPYFRLISNLRRNVNRALKSYSRTGKIMTSKKYGIDYGRVIEHLMNHKPPGVTDEELFNFRKWHVDHIYPVSKFDLNDPEEVKKAFAPENHQWLTAEENMKKGNKIIKKFENGRRDNY